MRIDEVQKKVFPIMNKYGIEHASVFGSFSRGESRPDSDMDILIKLGEESMGMLKYMSFIEEMEEVLGCKVDILTEGADKFLKPYILKDLKTIYEKR